MKRTLTTVLWLITVAGLCTAGTLLVRTNSAQTGKPLPGKMTLSRTTAPTAHSPAKKSGERPIRVTNPAAPQARQFSNSPVAGQISVAAPQNSAPPAAPRGRDALDSQGGPDAFGYRYVDNRGDSVAFNWIELCGDPQALNGPVGDNNVQQITWGWNFPFYGQTYTSAWISPNGLLSFGAADGSFLNDCIANLSPSVPKIYAYWDDQNAANVGGCINAGQTPWIRYRNFGSYVVFEWKNMPHYPTSNDRFTYEALLFPNGLVKLQYHDDFSAPDNPSSATVGIQNSGTGNGLEFTCNDAGSPIAGGLAVCFFPPGPCADYQVTAPGSWAGNTCRAWNDCPFRANEDLMYAVTIPHAGQWTFSLCDPNTNFPTYLALTTECCGGDLLAESTSGCPMGYPPILSEISCISLTAGTYYVDAEAQWGGCGSINLSVWECHPCAPPSPPGAIQENEQCYDGYVDHLDGGCNSDPPVYISLSNNSVVCGTSGIFTTDGHNLRDTDWYQITTTDTSIITWSVQAEFPVIALIIRGDEGCPPGGPQNLTGDPARACSTATAVSRCILPGTYWLFVAPQENLASLPCGVRYTATVHVQECTPPPPPANDNCENCMPMPDIPGSYNGNTTNATQQCQLLNDPEVWQCFTTPECSDVTITFCGTNPVFQTGFIVISTDCPCGNLIPCDMYEWWSCRDGNLTMHWYNLPAGTYYLPVIDEVDWHASGPYQVNISSAPCPPPPANDLCADAIGPLSVPSNTAGTTTGAGVDLDAPSCVTSIEAPGVWYSVNGTGNTITATTCNDAIRYDSKISIYCGDCTALNCVTGNDDNCSLGTNASTVQWCSEAGRLYYILVHGYSMQYGDFQLDLSDDGVPCFDAPACASCDIPQGPHDILENEPTCSDNYVDSYNGGCNSVPPVFGPVLQCGDTVYGTSGTFMVGDLYGRDTDWFTFHIAQPETIEFGAIAEFPVQMIIMSPGPDGGCADSSFYSFGAMANRCQTATTISPWQLDPGTYWLFLSPQDFAGVPCGAHYRAWLTCHALSCAPVTDLASYLTPDRQHVWLHFTAPAAGEYQIWSTDAANNDGDPNGGADPQWNLLATFNTSGSGAQAWTDPTPIGIYRNYVVIHSCTVSSASAAGSSAH